jgi:hypothetical protein
MTRRPGRPDVVDVLEVDGVAGHQHEDRIPQVEPALAVGKGPAVVELAVDRLGDPVHVGR